MTNTPQQFNQETPPQTSGEVAFEAQSRRNIIHAAILNVLGAEE